MSKRCNFASVFMVLDLRLVRIDCRETTNPFFCNIYPSRLKYNKIDKLSFRLYGVD